jgi:hypothetical protein
MEKYFELVFISDYFKLLQFIEGYTNRIFKYKTYKF